ACRAALAMKMFNRTCGGLTMKHMFPRLRLVSPSIAGTLCVAVLAAYAAPAGADEPAMSIEQAITFALAHHPSLRARKALDEAAQARTSEARSGLLPDVDVILQLNRATGNVLQGSLFSMHNIPSISGPPRPSVFDSGVWGTITGAGASWDVVGLSRR